MADRNKGKTMKHKTTKRLCGLLAATVIGVTTATSSGSGAMEVALVPRFDATDSPGTTYSNLPKLQWPVDSEGRAYLVY